MHSTLKPTDIPTPPQAALRIMQACSDENVDARRIAAIIGNDPVLTAELLRIVNSAFYSIKRDVRSIPQAVAIIGQRALRNMVLCITVRDSLRHSEPHGIDMGNFMDDMLRRAVCARLLGEDKGLDAQECFTAGILQDFGLLVMFKQQPVTAGEWQQLRRANPALRQQLEHELFGTTHDAVGLMIGRGWGLPDELTTVMACHHAADHVEIERGLLPACHVAECADWMAASFTAENTATTLAGCRERLRRYFDLDSGQVESLLLRCDDAVNEAASALGMRVHEPISFEQVMHQANRKLAEDNLGYQELVWKLEQTIAERDRLAAEIQDDLALAREIQQGLLPEMPAGDFPLCAVNLPAREVSGDFYDYFTLPDGRICFNIADVSGKGMNAALLMARTSSLFRCLGKAIHSPTTLLSMINQELFETAIRGRFVTMIAGIYDPASRQAQVVNAGHLPIIRLGADGSHALYPANASPLGITAEAVFEAITIPVADSGLFMYTDGLSECHDRGRSRLDNTQLIKLFRHIGKLEATAIQAALLDTLGLSADTLSDDLSILLIRGD